MDRRRQRLRRRRVAAPVVVSLLGMTLSACSNGIASGGARLSANAARSLAPASFSAGACVALAPTAGDRHRTVFLDAGHGGIDPGAVGTTTQGATVDEADATLPVELDAATLLRAQGFRVVVSRTGNSSVTRLGAADLSGGVLSLQGAHDDVVARALCADLARADALVGIYFDSGASQADAGSLATYDTVRPFAAANEQLANLLQQDVLATMNAQGWAIPDAGVLPDSQEGSLVQSSSDSPLAAAAARYGHLLLLGPAMAGYFSTPSEMPGAVIEPLFVTDPFEASIAASSTGQQVIAEGIATAVETFLPAPVAQAGHPRS
ncbi:MAG TPA: N-acetylmuramoyl-L-alanine amidase [Acidimicrobiales bacterium]|nr:N-acetylmuramoyl-L-alanine amidase [Acidimicrobiales bacterium]